MTAYEYLKSLHDICKFQTREGAKTGYASNGELRRWLKNKVLMVNHHKVEENEIMDYPIYQVSLFTKDKKITLM